MANVFELDRPRRSATSRILMAGSIVGLVVPLVAVLDMFPALSRIPSSSVDDNPSLVARKALGFVSNYCNLACENGGYCMFLSDDEEQRKLDSQQGKLIMKCSCPFLFTGRSCEIPVPRSEAPVQDSWWCNNIADPIDSFAGSMCRDPYTEYCNGAYDAEKPLLYCTNGGKCKMDFDAILDNRVDGGFFSSKPTDTNSSMSEADLAKYALNHPGCNCARNFYGTHCEKINYTSLMEPSPIPEDKNDSISVSESPSESESLSISSSADSEDEDDDSQPENFTMTSSANNDQESTNDGTQLGKSYLYVIAGFGAVIVLFLSAILVRRYRRKRRGAQDVGGNGREGITNDDLLKENKGEGASLEKNAVRMNFFRVGLQGFSHPDRGGDDYEKQEQGPDQTETSMMTDQSSDGAPPSSWDDKYGVGPVTDATERNQNKIQAWKQTQGGANRNSIPQPNKTAGQETLQKSYWSNGVPVSSTENGTCVSQRVSRLEESIKIIGVASKPESKSVISWDERAVQHSITFGETKRPWRDDTVETGRPTARQLKNSKAGSTQNNLRLSYPVSDTIITSAEEVAPFSNANNDEKKADLNTIEHPSVRVTLEPNPESRKQEREPLVVVEDASECSDSDDDLMVFVESFKGGSDPIEKQQAWNLLYDTVSLPDSVSITTHPADTTNEKQTDATETTSELTGKSAIHEEVTGQISSSAKELTSVPTRCPPNEKDQTQSSVFVHNPFVALSSSNPNAADQPSTVKEEGTISPNQCHDDELIRSVLSYGEYSEFGIVYRDTSTADDANDEYSAFPDSVGDMMSLQSSDVYMTTDDESSYAPDEADQTHGFYGRAPEDDDSYCRFV